MSAKRYSIARSKVDGLSQDVFSAPATAMSIHGDPMAGHGEQMLIDFSPFFSPDGQTYEEYSGAYPSPYAGVGYVEHPPTFSLMNQNEMQAWPVTSGSPNELLPPPRPFDLGANHNGLVDDSFRSDPAVDRYAGAAASVSVDTAGAGGQAESQDLNVNYLPQTQAEALLPAVQATRSARACTSSQTFKKSSSSMARGKSVIVPTVDGPPARSTRIHLTIKRSTPNLRVPSPLGLSSVDETTSKLPRVVSAPEPIRQNASRRITRSTSAKAGEVPVSPEQKVQPLATQAKPRQEVSKRVERSPVALPHDRSVASPAMLTGRCETEASERMSTSSLSDNEEDYTDYKSTAGSHVSVLDDGTSSSTDGSYSSDATVTDTAQSTRVTDDSKPTPPPNFKYNKYGKLVKVRRMTPKRSEQNKTAQKKYRDKKKNLAIRTTTYAVEISKIVKSLGSKEGKALQKAMDDYLHDIEELDQKFKEELDKNIFGA
nr:hypothetical protein L203_05926 [Cryptococcus depauperatus CBS 7841]